MHDSDLAVYGDDKGEIQGDVGVVSNDKEMSKVVTNGAIIKSNHAINGKNKIETSNVKTLKQKNAKNKEK